MQKMATVDVRPSTALILQEMIKKFSDAADVVESLRKCALPDRCWDWLTACFMRFPAIAALGKCCKNFIQIQNINALQLDVLGTKLHKQILRPKQITPNPD
jgi:hypothetical protein